MRDCTIPKNVKVEGLMPSREGPAATYPVPQVGIGTIVVFPLLLVEEDSEGGTLKNRSMTGSVRFSHWVNDDGVDGVKTYYANFSALLRA